MSFVSVFLVEAEGVIFVRESFDKRQCSYGKPIRILLPHSFSFSFNN